MEKTFFLRFFKGPLKKRGFRENATLKRGLDSSFVRCWHVEFVAIINHDVGKHAGACVPAFPRGRTPFTEGCEPFLPGDGNSCSKGWETFYRGMGTSFPVNVLPGAAGGSERPPAQNGQPLRAARPIFSNMFHPIPSLFNCF